MVNLASKSSPPDLEELLPDKNHRLMFLLNARLSGETRMAKPSGGNALLPFLKLDTHTFVGVCSLACLRSGTPSPH